MDEPEPDNLPDPDRVLLPDDALRELVFVFRLPVRLPVAADSMWTLEMEGEFEEPWHGRLAPHVSIRVNRIQRDSPHLGIADLLTTSGELFPPRADPNPRAANPSVRSRAVSETTTFRPPLLDYETVIEATTEGALVAGDRDSPSTTAGCFNRCLVAVNELVEAFGMALWDPTLAPVPIERLGYAAFAGSRRYEFQKCDVGPIFYILGWNVDVPRPEVDQAVLGRVTAYLSVASRSQPFLTYRRLRERSRAAMISGDYAVTVIMAAASGEVLLNLLLRSMLVEEGRETEIPQVFDRTSGGLATRIRTHYAPRLGGTWNAHDSGSAIGSWNVHTQAVRHRVVHGGYRPTRLEAHESMHGTEDLEGFVLQRLGGKRYSYPKTIVSLMGFPGLERRGLLNDRFASVVDDLTPNIHLFWDSVAKY